MNILKCFIFFIHFINILETDL